MSEWWTYRPQDFLLFSPRVYSRMFEAYNAALWPLQWLMLAVGFFALILALRHPRLHVLPVNLILAVSWMWVGWSFLWERYASINWAVNYVAPAFALQAVALAVSGLNDGATVRGRGGRYYISLALGIAGLLAYPLASMLLGRSWTGAEFFGIAPDPTAIVTLAILAMRGGVPAALLSIIPLLWLGLSGLTLHTMGEVQAWLPVSAAAISIALLAAGQGRNAA
jgi:hypothetical protein